MALIFNTKLIVDMIERVISIRRITKVTKGGRILNFSALVVVGDGVGGVGIGQGKAKETSAAILKAIGRAKKSSVRIIQANGSIAHSVIGKFGASKVMLMPSRRRRGIVANYSIRAILVAAGLDNITAKCYGSTNPLNVVLATMNGLAQQCCYDSASRRRGNSLFKLI